MNRRRVTNIRCLHVPTQIGNSGQVEGAVVPTDRVAREDDLVALGFASVLGSLFVVLWNERLLRGRYPLGRSPQPSRGIPRQSVLISVRARVLAVILTLTLTLTLVERLNMNQ